MKFTIDAEPFTGEVYEYVTQDELTWTEASQVEERLGYSLTEYNDPQRGEALRGRSLANVVFIWASIQRVRPQTTVNEVAATPRGALRVLPDAVDPTDGGPATDLTTETTDGDISQPSPSTSESDRGNGTD